jgi:hypothetical protein
MQRMGGGTTKISFGLSADSASVTDNMPVSHRSLMNDFMGTTDFSLRADEKPKIFVA